jgi:hypothetical protein
MMPPPPPPVPVAAPPVPAALPPVPLLSPPLPLVPPPLPLVVVVVLPPVLLVVGEVGLCPQPDTESVSAVAIHAAVIALFRAFIMSILGLFGARRRDAQVVWEGGSAGLDPSKKCGTRADHRG